MKSRSGTLLHFEAWLEGQLAFGIEPLVDTDFIGAYQSLFNVYEPDRDLRELMRRTPAAISSLEMQRAINYIKER